MSGSVEEFLRTLATERESRGKTIEGLLAAADSAKVFGQPVTAGAYTVIGVAEVATGGGFGSGMGMGMPPGRSVGDADPSEATDDTQPAGAGGGGGGGGGSLGRPVAAVVIGPDGVQVRPVFDVTKIGLAAVTAAGAIGILMVKMRKKR